MQYVNTTAILSKDFTLNKPKCQEKKGFFSFFCHTVIRFTKLDVVGCFSSFWKWTLPISHQAASFLTKIKKSDA